MYNILFGSNNNSETILSLLNLSEDDFYRFRDIYIENDEIVVLTRLGGGNREYYEHVFDIIEKHPLYIRNEDDEFYCTYCKFYFKIPEEIKESLLKVDKGNNSEKNWEKFEEIIGR